MRYFKGTFMWVIVLAAIAGYSYMDFESMRIEEKEKEEATRLFPFFPKDVLAITLEKEKDILELERWDDGWRIISPLKVKADDEAVEKFLGYVTDSRNDADYVMDADPSPARLLEFGLANPTVTVTFKVGKELKPYTLALGDRAPSKGVAYARLEGQKPVYRILAYARAEADKDIYYFRDKTVLSLNPIMIDQLVVERPELSLRVKLPLDGKWVIEKPIQAIADHNKVFELIGFFANAEVKEFVAETKNDQKKYGFDKPLAQMFFWLSGDSEPTVKLIVGARNPEKRGYYVSMSDRDNIFILEEDVINQIPRDWKDIRSKDLLFFEKELLKRIEIRKGTKSIVLVQDLKREWRRNNVSGEKVDFNLVDEFLDDLLAQKIEDFITDSTGTLSELGLDPPDIQLLLWYKDSATPTYLNVGKKTPAGYIYASVANEGTILALNEKIKRILTTYF